MPQNPCGYFLDPRFQNPGSWKRQKVLLPVLDLKFLAFNRYRKTVSYLNVDHTPFVTTHSRSREIISFKCIQEHLLQRRNNSKINWYSYYQGIMVLLLQLSELKNHHCYSTSRENETNSNALQPAVVSGIYRFLTPTSTTDDFLERLRYIYKEKIWLTGAG